MNFFRQFPPSGRSSNGRTADSGSAYRGSNPCLPAKSFPPALSTACATALGPVYPARPWNPVPECNKTGESSFVNFGLSSTRLTGRAVAIGSIHSSCGKPCGKTGHEDRNSLIHNEKDQAAHKWVYCFKVLIINTLRNLSKIRVPVGEDSAGSPEKTGFSTIGFREWPTGRGFWRSGPCKSNSSGAFDRKHGNTRCLPWYRST